MDCEGGLCLLKSAYLYTVAHPSFMDQTAHSLRHLIAVLCVCFFLPLAVSGTSGVAVHAFFNAQPDTDLFSPASDHDEELHNYSAHQAGEAITNPAYWQPLPNNTGHISPKDGHTWLKVTLTNQQEQATERLLEFAFPVTSMDIYELAEDGTLSPNLEDVGTYHEFAKRPINYRHIIYPVSLEPLKTRTFIFDIGHSYTKLIKLKTWTRDELQQVKSKEIVFFGMIYGALAMIVLYNLFIYFSIREKNHLLFVLFGTFTGLFISMHEGHFFQFIGVESNWPKTLMYSLVTASMCFFLSIFSISFLNIKRWSGLMYHALLGLGTLIALAILMLGLSGDPIIFSPQLILIIIFLYFFVIYCGLFVRNQGVSSAGLFSLAIFFCTLGLIFDFASNVGVLSWDRWAFSYASIGNASMILVFAFALADKMRLLHNEKLQASLQLIKLSEEKAQSNIEVYKSKLNQVQLEQRADEAKIESRAKSEFLATMSHQIRTPMNGVLGMIDLLEDTPLDQHQHHLVSSINKSAKSLLNVINDLLDYSKIESGKMELESKIFNLERIIDDCITISALKATETKLNFVGYIKPGTPLQLKGDAPKIRQVTLNLLNNVFSLSKGCDVLLQAFDTQKTTVNSLEIRIEIISRGLLLSEQECHALLQPFHDSPTRKSKGQELGLTLSQQLVELMQGDLGIDRDEENHSTTFWFTSRLLHPHKKEITPLTDRSKILSGRRVLLCDKHPDYVRIVKELTESWGMVCKAVTSNENIANILLNDNSSYQVLLINKDLLTPEIQLAVRKSNLDHNFVTSVTVLSKSRFTMPKSEMTKRGIQSILEVPSTTFQLYKSLLKAMGITYSEPDEGAEQSLNIIIAEDNTVNQMVIVGMLKKLKYVPKIANNGVETLNFYKSSQTPVDLVLMDCEMPELNGYEATKAIRKAEEDQKKKTVIIGLSAHSDPEYKTQAFESGMDDFIMKPVTIDHIEEILEKTHNGFFTDDKFNDSDDFEIPPATIADDE